MKGRSYPKDLKEAIVREVKEVVNISLVARKHGIAQSRIKNWIKILRKKRISE